MASILLIVIQDYHKPLDVTNLEQLASTCEDVDAVIHLAGKTSIKSSLRDPYRTYYINYVGALNLLELLG